MTGRRLLFVEDDDSIRLALGLALEDEGYEVREAPDGRSGLDAFTEREPDLVLLDLRLPDMSGFDVCRAIRARSIVPIIIVTARGEESDKIRGLNTGADDYVTKPFSPQELVARVRAVLRRSRPALGDAVLRHAGLEMDLSAHRVKRNARDVHLGPTEFRLLRHFMEHQGRVFSREQLLDMVWGQDVYVEPRTVDVHIRRLRKAINKTDEIDLIRTVRSAGYSLDREA